MRRSFCVFGMATLAMAVLAGTAAAQEKPEAAPAPGLDVPLPKPGPEHELLKKDVGVWDARVEVRMTADEAMQESKGVETVKLMGGGLWLMMDYKGEFFGMPYHGHQVLGYDPGKGKYVGTWVDSMAAGQTLMEGTYDEKARTLNLTIEGPCPDGTIMKTRTTTAWPTPDTRVFTMYSPAALGEEFAMMRITYTRRPASATADASR